MRILLLYLVDRNVLEISLIIELYRDSVELASIFTSASL
jgi:hypothetical protein